MAGSGRLLIAVGMIAVMVVALVLLLRSGGGESAVAATSTTSTTVAATTTTSLDPDARIAEVEQILEELYVGWYGAVYNNDEDTLADLVAIQLLYDAAVDAMESLEFSASPSRETIEVTVIDILLDRPDCLVVYRSLDLTQTLIVAEVNTALQVLWPRTDGGADYRLARLWSGPGDLWQDDCDLMDRTEIP